MYVGEAEVGAEDDEVEGEEVLGARVESDEEVEKATEH